MGRQVVVQSQTDLFQVIFALCAASGFAGLLNGWQQQCDEDGDDGDDDEQFDEGETAVRLGAGHGEFSGVQSRR